MTHAYRTQSIALATLLLIFSLNAPPTRATNPAETLRACDPGPALKGKARERRDSVALMTVAHILESQGESDFHLKFSPPAQECLVETFEVSGTTIAASYNLLEKGDSTLNYRFRVDRPDDDSEILVLYSGMAGLVAGNGFVLHVSEERKGVISWYAMFREEPPYTALKELVTEIAQGTAPPLMAVRWPPGSKEGEIVAYDDKKLR